MDRLTNSLLGIQNLRDNAPDLVNAYLNFAEKVKTSGAIDSKNKSLILLSLALQARCESCITFNTEAALNEGATKDEILEVCMLAVSMGGGPTMMDLNFVLETLESL